MNFFRLEEGLQMRMRHCRECCICLGIQMGLSENRLYSQWNSHLVGIMIINIGKMGYTIFRHTQMRFGRGCLWKLFRLGFLEVPQTLRHLLGSNFPWQRSKTGGWGTTYEKVGMCPQISRAALEWWVSSCIFLLSREDGSKSSTPYFLKEMQELMLKMTDFPRPLIPATVAATTLVPGAKAKAEAADFSVNSHSHRALSNAKRISSSLVGDPKWSYQTV